MDKKNLKPVPKEKKTSLGKLPTEVRNKIGFQASGGKVKKMTKGGNTKPKPRPGSEKITKESLVGGMTKAEVEDAISKGKNPTRKKGDRAGVTSKKLKPNTTNKKILEAISNLSPISKAAAAGKSVEKMGMGGKCRGMGAATRGGNFSRNG